MVKRAELETRDFSTFDAARAHLLSADAPPPSTCSFMGMYVFCLASNEINFNGYTYVSLCADLLHKLL